MNHKKQASAIQQLQAGIAIHNAGRLDEADLIYQKVLTDFPLHPDALHLRALIFHAMGDHRRALEFASAAIAASPRVANFFNTAGECQRKLNAVPDAILNFQNAIRLSPGFAMPHHNLALCFEEAGQIDEARAANQRAVALAPNRVDALVHGLKLAVRGKAGAAATVLAEQLAKLPATADAVAMLLTYQLFSLENAIERGDIPEADLIATGAQEYAPQNFQVWLACGEFYKQQNRFSQAEHALYKAAKLAPENEAAQLGIALFMVEQQRFAEAYVLYADWLKTHPASSRAQFGVAWIELAEQRFSSGWRNFEARWQLPEHASPKYIAAKEWNGDPVRHLLLYAEQGLGDSVMFLRFLPAVLARNIGAITLLLPPALERIARSVSADRRLSIVSQLPAAPDCDAACALMSLPRALALSTVEEHRAAAPYLFANAARTQYFRQKLTALRGPKIGLVWAGGAAGVANQRRQLNVDALQPLLADYAGSLVALQFGQTLPFANHPGIDLRPDIRDFDDLAAAMMAVDVVISVDSGPAHLAGALGRPCLTLVPWLHDWRWGSEGESSYWYAGMRLIRQQIGDDWAPAIASLIACLRATEGTAKAG